MTDSNNTGTQGAPAQPNGPRRRTWHSAGDRRSRPSQRKPGFARPQNVPRPTERDQRPSRTETTTQQERPLREPRSGNQPRPEGTGNRNTKSRNRFGPRRPSKKDVKHVNHVPTRSQKGEHAIPELQPRTVRIIPLGGVEEIGRNMTAIEYGDDIIVVDCGLAFPEDDTPGIDYILPNTGYLEDNKDRVRGLVITHGHLDHIGGIPYIIGSIGNPPIYTRKLTAAMVKKRNEEFPHLEPLDVRIVENNIGVRLGSTTVSFFGVTHTIPDAMGVIIKTEVGDVVITGDIKLVHEAGVVDAKEAAEFDIFEKNRPLVLMMDSTNCEIPGWSIDERRVFTAFEEIVSDPTLKRIFIGTFASQLERVIKIIEIAERNGRKVVVDGRSMKTNIAIAEELGMLKTQKGTLVSVEDIDNYPPEKVVVLVTGAQGDDYASLMRMANKTHKYLKLRPDDTIVLSSSVIPGNERSVQRLKDNLSRQGAFLITYQSSDVHASGHGYREEYRWIHQKIRPKFFIPQHGYHYKLRNHADLIRESIGMPRENIIIPDNSSIIEIRNEGTELVKLDVKAPANTRVVEGHTVSDIQTTVLRDRKALSTDGIFVLVITLDQKTGRLRKSPDIISRGFIYLRESQDLLAQTRLIIKKHTERIAQRAYPIDTEAIKNEVAEAVGQFLFQQTNKNPIVIPVVASI
jgi:ribonuclease J